MASGGTTDIELFVSFLEDQVRSGRSDLSPEQSVEEFRVYRESLIRFQDDSRESIEESASGKAQAIDVDALKSRVIERLANQGIKE